MLQTVYRVSAGSFQGLRADCNQRHSQAYDSGENENFYSDVCSIGEFLYPLPHHKIGDGPGDEVSSQDPFKEFLVEQCDDAQG